jgi:isocitrate dehydrogenase
MVSSEIPDIVYTKVDEAPELASASLLPIIQRFAAAAGVSVGSKDISLSGRILATFPDFLKEDQRIPNDLAELGELVKRPEANVIKLPNISASVPQLVDAVEELQGRGFGIPDYPESSNYGCGKGNPRTLRYVERFCCEPCFTGGEF